MITKEEVCQRILDLIPRFGEQIDSYKQADCNETLTRRGLTELIYQFMEK